jgi:hypothetical protein
MGNIFISHVIGNPAGQREEGFCFRGGFSWRRWHIFRIMKVVKEVRQSTTLAGYLALTWVAPK